MSEIEPDILRVTFSPREGSLLTDFEIKYEDVPMLVQLLIDNFRVRPQEKFRKKDE